MSVEQGTRYWAEQVADHFTEAESWLKLPPDEGTLMAAQVHATLAAASATRLLAEVMA